MTMDSFEGIAVAELPSRARPKPSEFLASALATPYLNGIERAKLRRSIEGTVASMIADNLAGRFHVGLEHDRVYQPLLARFRELLLAPATRLGALRRFLLDDLPAGRPDFFKILFLESLARQLGREWMNDECDFIDVTVGSARLQELILALGQDYRQSGLHQETPMAAIMVPFGEQHTLMPTLLGVLFDTLGWAREIIAPDRRFGPGFTETVTHADVACIGWSNSRLTQEVSAMVHNIRQLHPHKKLPIIVGGVAALQAVDFLVDIGVDCICDSVYSAARICQNFHELQSLALQAQRTARTAMVKSDGLDWLDP